MLKENKVKIALSSLSSKENGAPKKTKSVTGKIQEIKLAEDPIVLLYRADSECKNIFSNGDSSKSAEEFQKLFSGKENSNGKNCKNLTLFVREGGETRSNLNKTIFNKGNLVDSFKLHTRELPENNFLALQFFQREAGPNSLLYLPKSFYELNKDYFGNYSSLEFKKVNLEGTSSVGSQNTGNAVNSYKKELQLLVNNAQGEEEFLKKVLLNSDSLSSLHLTPELYCQSNSSFATQASARSNSGEECKNSSGKKGKDVDKLFKKSQQT